MIARVTLLSLITLIAVNTPAFADDKIFEVDQVDSIGRVVTGQFADFDGDQRKDLMVVTLEGLPPEESRTIHVYIQGADGSFPEHASHSVPIPRWSAVYDVADLKDTPGDELILLRPDGVTLLSLANDAARQWDLPVEGSSTVGASVDERGFDPFRMVYYEFAEEPWILVPQIGAVSVLSTDGTLIAQIDVGRRANYFIAKSPGLISVESDMQLYLDVPKLGVGDVDGDGQMDIIASTRHEIRVFLRDEDGGFASQASYALPIGLISQLDHTRGTGSVVTTARDIDNDGLLDLMISHAQGSFADTMTTTYVYHNRNGSWDLHEPGDRFVSKGTLSSDLFIDVDQDNSLELVRIQLKFSVFEIIELLLTRKVDTLIEIHRFQSDGHFGEKPWSRKKISTAISFETFRPKGFMPTAGVDVNADGLIDFITSANGKGIEVYLGGDDGPFSKRTALQRLSSAGVIRFSDFDDDGLPDFVLFNPLSFDAPVQIGRNLGELPRTRSAVANE